MKINKRMLFGVSLLLSVFPALNVLAGDDQPGIPLLLLNGSATVPTVVSTVTSVTGRVWMDRNLGASRVATSSNDELAYGDLYQWGRLTDGHEKRTSGTIGDLSYDKDNPGHGNFILSYNDPLDWRTPQNDSLWLGVAGTNNPCPAGFRLPTDAEWQAEIDEWSSNDPSVPIASPLKLVAAGSRFYNQGTISNAGTLGFYWSSTVSGIFGGRFFFSDTAAIVTSSARAYGFSVRCTKE